ncbi:hypothetical protein K438DRAFT_1812292 [Mycena galopus ATCC 62051]|nr:hypothetical protein K438DRAFT_1812292 [Mycena galopus ATCC 62051]
MDHRPSSASIMAMFVRCDGYSTITFRQFHCASRFMRPTEESIRHPSPLPAAVLSFERATCTAGRWAHCDYNFHPIL